MKISELLQESIPTDKPKIRNYVAKNAKSTTSGAGAHKDRKKASKAGEVKHKKDMFSETATAGATSAGNVGIGVVCPNKSGKTHKNKDGTAKNALDIKNANIFGGKPIKR